jgi:hypothetical protein
MLTRRAKATNITNKPKNVLVQDVFGSGGDLVNPPKKPVSKKKTKEIAGEAIVEGLIAVPKATDLPPNYQNLNNNAKNVAESSVIFPPEFPEELLGTVRRKWRELCSGQVFNGDLLERDFLQYVTASGPYLIIDIDRYEATSSGSMAFQQIVKMRPAGKVMFFKGNFDLKKVNSFTDVFARIQKPKRGKSSAINTNVQWSQIKTYAKGKDNVQPDVLVWEWDGRNRPILNIIEMKAGFGEAGATDSEPSEYIQLCRCKRLFEDWLDTLENAYTKNFRPQLNKLRKTLKGAAPHWIRPEIKLWFVAFSAKRQDQIMFGKPGKVWTIANKGKYDVTPLTGEEFGTRFGIATPFVSEAVGKLNEWRNDTLQQTINLFRNPPNKGGDPTLHAAYLKARANRERTVRAYVRSQRVMRAPLMYLGNNNENVASYAGLSGFVAGTGALTTKSKKNTIAKIKKLRAARVASATKPQQVRINRAVKLANTLLNQASKGHLDPLTHNFNASAEEAIQTAAQGNAKLINLARRRAKEIDPNFASNNLAAEQLRQQLMNNVLNNPLFAE